MKNSVNNVNVCGSLDLRETKSSEIKQRLDALLGHSVMLEGYLSGFLSRINGTNEVETKACVSPVPCGTYGLIFEKISMLENSLNKLSELCVEIEKIG